MGAGAGAGSESGSGVGSSGSGVGSSGSGGDPDSHWVRWHAAYENPSSPLSQRMAAVQSMVRAALDEIPSAHPGPIRIVSLCAGQGRDVIDVVATHPRGPEVSALLIELDPALVAFARDRAARAGLVDGVSGDGGGAGATAGRIRIVEGDASQSHWCADSVPADIKHIILARPGWCVPGGHVIWTRHRRPPDLTPSIRADFAEAGFTELAFETPGNTITAVGHHRLDGETAPFDLDEQLFNFVGDGWNPA